MNIEHSKADAATSSVWPT